MSFSVGIVGLPNVGKSTLFKALTKQSIAIAPRPFTTISPNHGIVAVPDERLIKIAKIINPEKITLTIIEFVDIAGLVKEAHKGQGLGNQFLAQIRNCDAVCEVIRTFKSEEVAHVEEYLNPKRDVEIINTELLMKDLETLDKIVLALEKSKDKEGQKKFHLIKKIKEEVAQGKCISKTSLSEEEKAQIKEFQFLTDKPILYIENAGKQSVEFEANDLNIVKLNLKLEEEISVLSKEEYKEIGSESLLANLIIECYKILDLITFYTIAGGKEVRAWALKKDSTIIQAANLVHSDFSEKFIKAEVINWENLIKMESWKKAREAGTIKIKGKDYLVQDGDVIEFKI